MTHSIDTMAAQDRLGGADLTGVLASDIRVVAMDFREGGTTTHMVLADDIDLFIAACKRLHFKPGVNPYNGVETSHIWRLRVSELKAQGPYWWAKPCLGQSVNSHGAMTIHEGISRTVWIDETYEVLA